MHEVLWTVAYKASARLPSVGATACEGIGTTSASSTLVSFAVVLLRLLVCASSALLIACNRLVNLLGERALSHDGANRRVLNAIEWIHSGLRKIHSLSLDAGAQQQLRQHEADVLATGG